MSRMDSSKSLPVSSHDESINSIAWRRYFERRIPRIQAKQNDSGSEEVIEYPIVRFPFQLLRTHVSFGPAISSQSLLIVFSCQSEVSNFDIKVWVEQDIFRFDISVHDISLMDCVEPFQYLFVEELRHWLFKLPTSNGRVQVLEKRAICAVF